MLIMFAKREREFLILKLEINLETHTHALSGVDRLADALFAGDFDSSDFDSSDFDSSDRLPSPALLIATVNASLGVCFRKLFVNIYIILGSTSGRWFWRTLEEREKNLRGIFKISL